MNLKALIVYWHPEPKSFNNAMFQTGQIALREAGFRVETSDLFTMGFDPASSRKNFTTVSDPDYLKLQLEEIHATEHGGFADDIEAEISKIEACDLMIWQFPLWWFGLPSVFKGWVDRVFALGRVYSHSKSFENGAFKGKRALLSLTTGGSAGAYQAGGFAGSLDDILWQIHRGMLQFIGFDVLAPHCVHAPVRMSDQQRQNELDQFATRLASIMDEDTYPVKGS